MSMRERISGIWLMAMTLLALFAFTCYFVAQMWLNMLRLGYIALVVSQVLALTIYMWGPEKLKRRWQGLLYPVCLLLLRHSRLPVHLHGPHFPVPRPNPGQHPGGILASAGACAHGEDDGL